MISLLAGFILLGTGILVNDKIRETFTGRARILSMEERFSFYHAALMAFRERPVWGYGYRNFEPNVLDIKKNYDIGHRHYGAHAHNNFLEHLASTGFMGALSFVLFTLSWLIHSYQREDVVGKISFPVVVSFIISGMFQYTFGDGENLFLLMLLWAL